MDTSTLKVRYLAVHPGGAAHGTRILVPVEYVRLDATRRVVWLDVHSPDALRELPAWDGRAPIPAPPDGDGPPAASLDFYDHPRFSARRFFRSTGR